MQEGARLKSKAMPGLGEAGGEVGRGEVSPNEEVMGEAGGVHKELEEPMVQEQQRLLETRLREAKAMAEDSKGAMKEMEGVIAGLRGEEVRPGWVGGIECGHHWSHARGLLMVWSSVTVTVLVWCLTCVVRFVGSFIVSGVCLRSVCSCMVSDFGLRSVGSCAEHTRRVLFLHRQTWP